MILYNIDFPPAEKLSKAPTWVLWRIPISSKYFDCWLVATALAGLHWLWMKLDQVVQRLSSRLKLQPGSSENNPNVPVLVEVWHWLHSAAGTRCRWSEAMPLHSRGGMEGSISCATPSIVLVKWARQQNCPEISSKSWITATASHPNCKTWLRYVLNTITHGSQVRF